LSHVFLKPLLLFSRPSARSTAPFLRAQATETLPADKALNLCRVKGSSARKSPSDAAIRTHRRSCMVSLSIAGTRDDGWRSSAAVIVTLSHHDSPCWREFRPVLPCRTPSCEGQGYGT
jgi:hypothetical protein